MSFKTFLNEYKTREKEHQLMVKGSMPLSPSIMKEWEIKIEETYHVTSVQGYKHLLKMEGQRKDISTFTKGSDGLAMGAREETQLLLKLKGYSSFSSEADLFSNVDRNGHRWLDPLRSDNDFIINNEFKVPMFKMIVELLKLNDRFEIELAVHKMTGKEKKEFIKWYFDTSKKLITKKLLDKIKISIENKNSSYTNNEILLHNFKIIEVQIVADNEEIANHIKNSLEAEGLSIPKKIVKPSYIEQMK